MEWWLILIFFAIGFIFLLLTGLPIAFTFGILNITAILVLSRGETEMLRMLAMTSYDSISKYAFVAIPLFIIMGEIMFHTGLAGLAISGIDKWVGRVPGRLGVLGTITGAVFGAASGSSMASAATIGATLIPEMLERGYSRPLAMGCIACSGGLAILIPPSALMVIFGGIAQMSVGHLLIGGIIPGLLIAVFMLAYIIILAKLKPEVAPPYGIEAVTLLERLASLKHLVPIVGLIVIVLGSIFFGIATPSEAAAMGAFGAFLLAAAYRRLTLSNIQKSLLGTIQISSMCLLIITTAVGFSQILAMTGVTAGLTGAIIALSVHPMAILFTMNLVVFIMGCIMDSISIMLVTIPIFLPLAKALGFDLLWWAIIMMVNIEVGMLTPPFGLNLFIVKGVTPGEVTTTELYRGIFPFVAIQLLAMIVMIFFPALVTWLPGLMM